MSKKKKKKPMTKGRYRFKLAMQVIVLLLLLTMLALGVIFYIAYGRDIFKLQDEAKELVRSSTTETFRQSETSLIYDVDGNVLTTLKGEKDVYYIAYEDIPEYAKDAMISIEDKRFETHIGIDFKGIMRAVKALIVNKGEIHQGASTITQQLARNIFLTHEVSWERKIKEMFIAMELEKRYSKDQIMEFYLNNIYFGNGYYGIQAASKGYYKKEVENLSLGEITFLCAIPNNPALYDPYHNRENTEGRQGRILDQMVEEGKITAQEAEEAKQDEITLKKKKAKKYNYVETYVYNCAIRALMENQGFTFRNSFDSEEDKERYDERYDELYAVCQQSLYSAGYRIYTSIDKTKQKALQAAVDDTLSKFDEKTEEGIYAMQGAATCIDNETGRVVAIVGGRSQNLTGYTLNRAYQSFRQPGSSIKPLLVYTPMLERGYRPDTMVEDKKTEDGPRNSDGTYSGKITLRTAVEKSKNTVAWKLFEELTPSIGIQYLLSMNFAKIDKNDYFPAASLGGLTNGVSTVEMASAFAALENDGKYREPTCIVMIMNSRGETIVGDTIDEKIIYDQNAARMMTDVLTGVLTRGTGRSLKLTNMTAAGKTGTTNDKKDGWFVGYTPYYTTGVWVGYDIPKTVKDLYGSTYPGAIWKSYMNTIHEGLANKGFEPYEGVKEEPEETEEPEELEEEDDIAEDITVPEDEQIPEDETSGGEDMENEPEAPGAPVEEPEEEPEEEIPDETTPEEPSEPVIPEEEEPVGG
ncbi:transglycosylase domain-containing protein [Acetivibrio ethanolgignens]|uniref:transglycosylase domain-containing protein n=1 Tax=Acetivibrio ethanolgignens TaxID=290052 RepID=UPI0009FB1D1A|nr:PBP1A family penicillin-binding protein [Acetivibrio ethanolgignens]